ncbi:hypothetical protein V8E54_011628 [Elaphomyces granulatus]|jgi:hypothetical protein
MSTNFLSLPGELRNGIYELLLLRQEPIEPLDYCRRYELTPGLLRTSKTIHREASSLLYAQNRFDFSTLTHKEVASFLEQIGRINANSVRHIIVSFPTIYLDRHDVTLEDDRVHLILAQIQSDCAKLSTLTTSLYSAKIMKRKLDALDDPELVAEALLLVDTRFRAILSLQYEIIVQVYSNSLSDHIRKEMQSHGWTISATNYWEVDSGFSLDWISDYSEDQGCGHVDETFC